MAIEPAAISARPPITIRRVCCTAPESPAASAKGTVRPSDIPITVSRTKLPAVKCFSTCGVCGIRCQTSGWCPNFINHKGHEVTRRGTFYGSFLFRRVLRGLNSDTTLLRMRLQIFPGKTDDLAFVAIAQFLFRFVERQPKGAFDLDAHLWRDVVDVARWVA